MDAIELHQEETYKRARSLNRNKLYHWLLEHGYYPESYVLPPCFKVTKHPKRPKRFFPVTKKGKQYKPQRHELIEVHFPKSELTDRTFGVVHPEIHNDIAYDISRHWVKIVDTIFHVDNDVACYSFPLPIDKKQNGRIGVLRAGRLIYEFINMSDADVVSISYKYSHVVKTDIKNFYPSIYTHSLSWALHGKKKIKKSKFMHDFNLVGNRLDKLFQNANDGCTNGLPIGPVVSDIAAEFLVASADRDFSTKLRDMKIDCRAIRFKDDYRILVNSESDAKLVVKILQASLKEFNLQLSDEKTSINPLPQGLFREWVSHYHQANPVPKKNYNWKEFRELYLSVLRIDKQFPGTGVVDRFLADVTNKQGRLKIDLLSNDLEKMLSMLFMLGNLRIKAFPKIIAIVEATLDGIFVAIDRRKVLRYLANYLRKLSEDEERNKYLIAWIGYFIVSNGFERYVKVKPKLVDPITRSIVNNRSSLFKSPDFRIFEGCRAAGKKVTMTEHLAVFESDFE